MVFTTVLKLAQLMMPVVLAALIPWGSWVTYKVIVLEEWKGTGPYLTQKDASSLKLEIKNEAYLLYERRVVLMEAKLDQLTVAVAELKMLLLQHEENTRPPKNP